MRPDPGSRPRLSPLLVAIAALVVGVGLRAHADPGSATLTIYKAPGAVPITYGGSGYGGSYPVVAPVGAGYAVVTERRAIDLVKGQNQVSFAGVAAGIDASTVQFKSNTDPEGTSVVEQNYAYDLASPDALLYRYVDHDITVVTDGGEVTGKLLSYDASQLVVKTGDAKYPIRILQRSDNVRDIRFGALTEGLVTQPTLNWMVMAQKAGKHDTEVTYRTTGLAWSADYTAILDPTKAKVDLTGWVSLSNSSGVTFKDASLVLVTAAENTAQPTYATGYVGAAPTAIPPQVYKLDRPTTLVNGDTVQLELFAPVTGAKSTEVMIYEPLANTAYYASGYPNSDCYSYQYQPVKSYSDKYLELTATGKGTMPDGRVRVFQRTKDGALELIGEDQMSPDDAGAMRLHIGTSDEIKGERKQVSCTPNPNGRSLEEKIELKISNNGAKAVDLVVKEYMQRWSNWVLTAETQKGKKVGIAGEEYRLKLPAGGSKTVTYTVTYTW